MWSPKKIELFYCFTDGIFGCVFGNGFLRPGDGLRYDIWSRLLMLMSLIAFDMSLVRLFSSLGLLVDRLELCSLVLLMSIVALLTFLSVIDDGGLIFFK